MISSLQFISNDFSRSHIDNITLACEYGLKWIQLRVKNVEFEDYQKIALEAQDICIKHNATLIINDNWQLAEKILADGVHVGLTDTSVDIIRKSIGNQFIIGGSANNFEDVKLHFTNDVDYVGVGPYQFTKTKEKLSPILGLKGYESLLKKLNEQKINIPIIAIGGIKVEDIEKLKSISVFGIAFSSLFTEAENKTKTVETLYKHFN